MKNKEHLDKFFTLNDEFVYALIDNPYECPIVIDNRGIIKFMSRHSQSLIGIDPKAAVGKHVADVIKDTHLHEVLSDGKARIGDMLFIGGRQQLISRIPLKDSEGCIIGAVGKSMLNEVSKLWDLQRKMEIMNSQLQYFQQRITDLRGGAKIIGKSEAIQRVKDDIALAAKSNASVLITGESGTGKEVFANAIHQESLRAQGPFIRVNCASIPHELFESELFGYEGGAFTGARSGGKPGKFELANGGTILLDEIGEMPLMMQAKLLRVLQEHSVDRLGGTKPITTDFRLIASTNKDLRQMIEDGLFRTDLFYRINILHIHAPSLREIRDDIPLLADHLVALLNQEVGWEASGISEEVQEALKKYHWPGNVRELRNVLERSMIISKGYKIRVEDLPERVRRHDSGAGVSAAKLGNLRQVLAETEKKLIMDTISQVNGNKVKASKLLGIHRTSLYDKLKSFAEGRNS